MELALIVNSIISKHPGIPIGIRIKKNLCKISRNDLLIPWLTIYASFDANVNTKPIDRSKLQRSYINIQTVDSVFTGSGQSTTLCSGNIRWDILILEIRRSCTGEV